jgi:hypothetical protein
MYTLKTVIPAKAGTPLSSFSVVAQSWAPAFAGVTVFSFDLEFGV